MKEILSKVEADPKGRLLSGLSVQFPRQGIIICRIEVRSNLCWSPFRN